MEILDDHLYSYNTPVGGESCRSDLYGAPVSIDLGLVLLPSLAGGDLWVLNEQLAQLLEEVSKMSRHAEEVCTATGFDLEYVERKVEVIAQAVRLAEEVRGGIVIW